MAKLVIIRGVPGSGKSTLAKNYIGFENFEADMFFIKDGVYNYDPTRIADAHQWCQQRTFEALMKGKNVVVSNTFIKVWQIQPYLDMASALGAEVEVITATGNYKNIHSVPQKVVERMREEFEDFSL